MRYTASCKAVRDNIQRVVYDTDIGKVKIISKSGRKKVFEVSFNIEDYLHYKPTFNNFWNMKEFIRKLLISKGKDALIEGGSLDCLFDRIVDSQCTAFRDVLKQVGEWK